MTPIKVIIVTRSFQAGAGKDNQPFNTAWFDEQVKKPLQHLFHHNELFAGIVVVTNTDERGGLGEQVASDGFTPTQRALNCAFPKEVGSGLLTLASCSDWGNNPGSATALNHGDQIAYQRGAAKVIHWSPEIELSGYHIQQLLTHVEQHHLLVAGLLRQRWWEKAQWNVAQNTISIWDLSALRKIGGFDPNCNGNGDTIGIPEYGQVPLAGMEDFHAILRLMKLDPINFRWGMVGRSQPLKWNTAFTPNSQRELNHQIKVARQYQVMRHWSGVVYPELSFETVMDQLFACYHLD